MHSDDREWLEGQSVTSKGKLFSRGRKPHPTDSLATKKNFNLSLKQTSAAAQSVTNQHAQKLLQLSKSSHCRVSTNTGRSSQKAGNPTQGGGNLGIIQQPLKTCDNTGSGNKCKASDKKKNTRAPTTKDAPTADKEVKSPVKKRKISCRNDDESAANDQESLINPDDVIESNGKDSVDGAEESITNTSNFNVIKQNDDSCKSGSNKRNIDELVQQFSEEGKTQTSAICSCSSFPTGK